MPILSSQVRFDIEKQNQRYYKDTEWSIAQRRYDETRNLGNPVRVIPVVTGGYKVSGNYHKETPECIRKYTAFDLSQNSIEQLKLKIGILLEDN